MMDPTFLTVDGRMRDRPRKVMIVEDEALIALDLQQRLERAGYEVVGVADNLDDALELCRESRPDLALMDIYIRPPADGIETAAAMQRVIDIPVIFLTAYADEGTLKRAAEAGPYGYLLKPFDERTLLATLTMAFGRFESDLQLRLLGAAVEATNVGIAVLDLEGHVQMHNSALGSTLRVTGPLLGRLPEIPTTDPHDETFLAITQALSTGETASGVVRSRGEGAQEHWMRLSVSPVLDRTGQRSHSILTAVDITAEKQTQDALEARERDLADLASLQAQVKVRADQLESSLQQLRATQAELIQREKLASLGLLVAGVAHDLNTPIGVARTAGELLGEAFESLQEVMEFGEGPPRDAMEQLEASLGLLRSNLDRARTLVRRFSSLAFDQNAEMVSRVELGEAVRSVLETLGPLTRRSGLQVSIDAPEDIQLSMRRGLLAQLLTNLVTNAGLHAYDGQGGSLEIRVERSNEGAVLRVSDQGAGMPEDVKARIFEPFYTTKGGKGGSGLGLFITHNIVHEGLGGRLEVETVLGEGTSFIIHLPLEHA